MTNPKRVLTAAELEGRLNRAWARIDGRAEGPAIDADDELAWAIAACADCSAGQPCAKHPADCDDNADDHDPVTFALEHGDPETAARGLHAGDVYRKSLFGLDETGVTRLRAHLARRGLTLIDDDKHWVIGTGAEKAPR